MHPTLNIAIKAARRAATVINRASLDVDLLRVETKSPNDFVTEVDRAAEEAIIQVLRDAYPSHSILAEESGETGPEADTEYQWIIHPLDGTTNFLHGFPQYAISIALARRGVVEQAVVFDPNRNEMFTASKGAGAFLNDRRIRVSKRLRLQEALVGTGFPYRQFANIDTYLAIFKELTQKTAGLRRPGAAALDLAYVAAGRLDGHDTNFYTQKHDCCFDKPFRFRSLAQKRGSALEKISDNQPNQEGQQERESTSKRQSPG